MKVLMIRLRSIGDIIQCTPAFDTVRRLFKDAEIDLMVDERFGDLVRENSAVDSLIFYRKTGGFFNKLREDSRIIKLLKKQSYDVVLDFHGIPKTAWMAYFSGARVRVGYNYPWRGFLYTHRMAVPKKFSVHSALNQVNLLKALPAELISGFKFPDLKELNTFMKADFAAGECAGFLKNNGVENGYSLFLYHISPSNMFKKWPAENYAGLISMIENHSSFAGIKKAHIVLGTQGDTGEVKKIFDSVKLLSGKLISACGSLSLGGLFNLAKKAALYVGPDSGPLHIASAAGCSAIGLFGPTTTEIFGPVSKSFTGIYDSTLSCRPCEQKKCVSNDFRCINKIKLDDVFNVILNNNFLN